MPYYNKRFGVMSDVPWDKFTMEVVTLQQFAKHQVARPELEDKYCMRCVTAVVLETLLEKFIIGE